LPELYGFELLVPHRLTDQLTTKRLNACLLELFRNHKHLSTHPECNAVTLVNGNVSGGERLIEGDRLIPLHDDLQRARGIVYVQQFTRSILASTIRANAIESTPGRADILT
jgi:hypothetical protein